MRDVSRATRECLVIRKAFRHDVTRLAALLLVCSTPLAGHAQPRTATVRVATRIVKPFVFEEGGQLTGFSIELWKEISSRLNLRSEFVVKPTVQDLLDSVKSRDTILGIAAVSITAEREKELDLSQPMFDAGLQVLAPVKESQGSIVAAIVAGVLSSAALPILGIVLLIILVI